MPRRKPSSTNSYSSQKPNGANLGFEEKMTRMTAKLEEQFQESTRLETVIRQNLGG